MVTTIKYGKWTQAISQAELDMIAIKQDILLQLWQEKIKRTGAQEGGWELLPGPPERRELPSPFQPMAVFIWPVCRVTETER